MRAIRRVNRELDILMLSLAVLLVRLIRAVLSPFGEITLECRFCGKDLSEDLIGAIEHECRKSKKTI